MCVAAVSDSGLAFVKRPRCVPLGKPVIGTAKDSREIFA
jgi:hypothetical protein